MTCPRCCHARRATLGRLRSWIARWERAPDKVQPVAPDGHFELIPPGLRWAPGPGAIWAAVSVLARRDIRPEIVQELLDELPSRFGRESTPLDGFERLVAPLELDSDDDVDVLYQRLGAGSTPGARRVVLDADKYAAYKRVTERILTAWHGDHPLERFLYRGSG